MARLQAGPTNAADAAITAGRGHAAGSPITRASSPPCRRLCRQPLPSAGARRRTTPSSVRPSECFALPVVRFGNVVVAVQPARGYNIDPEKSYHDPDLPPPHGYLAFYAWLRAGLDAHAVVHVGKHGNVEWLPGKALALSAECFRRPRSGRSRTSIPSS